MKVPEVNIVSGRSSETVKIVVTTEARVFELVVSLDGDATLMTTRGELVECYFDLKKPLSDAEVAA